MVTITKDNHTVVVTNGVYESQFKPLGYTILNKKPVEEKKDIEKDIVDTPVITDEKDKVEENEVKKRK